MNVMYAFSPLIKSNISATKNGIFHVTPTYMNLIIIITNNIINTIK